MITPIHSLVHCYSKVLVAFNLKEGVVDLDGNVTIFQFSWAAKYNKFAFRYVQCQDIDIKTIQLGTADHDLNFYYNFHFRF